MSAMLFMVHMATLEKNLGSKIGFNLCYSCKRQEAKKKYTGTDICRRHSTTIRSRTVSVSSILSSACLRQRQGEASPIKDLRLSRCCANCDECSPGNLGILFTHLTFCRPLPQLPSLEMHLPCSTESVASLWPIFEQYLACLAIGKVCTARELMLFHRNLATV